MKVQFMYGEDPSNAMPVREALRALWERCRLIRQRTRCSRKIPVLKKTSQIDFRITSSEECIIVFQNKKCICLEFAK